MKMCIRDRHVIDELPHLRLGDIEDILYPGGIADSGLVVIDPVRVLLVKLSLGIDHFRLHPDAEHHTQIFYRADELLQSIGELTLIDVPVPQPILGAMALSEPAVVQHKQLRSQFPSLLGQLDLILAVDMELRGLPGVVQHRAAALPQ